MTEPEVYDFDEAWKPNEPPSFQWQVTDDVELEMPGSTPAGAALLLHQLHKVHGPDADLAPAELVDLAVMFFGRDAVEKIVGADDFEIVELEDAVGRIIAEYKRRDGR